MDKKSVEVLIRSWSVNNTKTLITISTTHCLKAHQLIITGKETRKCLVAATGERAVERPGKQRDVRSWKQNYAKRKSKQKR